MGDDDSHRLSTVDGVGRTGGAGGKLFLEGRAVFRRVFPHACGVVGADALEERFHRIEARLVGNRAVDDLSQRPGTGWAHERAGGNEVGEVERRGALLLRLLHDRRGADGEVRFELLQRGQIVFERCTVLHVDAVGFEPCGVVGGPFRLGASRADIAQVRAGLDQQAGDEQFGAFVAGKRDAALDGHGSQRTLDGGQDGVRRGVDLGLLDVAGLADGFQPGLRSLHTDRRGTDNGSACRVELAEGGGVERVDGGNGRAIERGIKFAPLTARQNGARFQPHGLQHLPDADRVDGEHLAHQRDARLVAVGFLFGRLHRTGGDFLPRIVQHRTGQHVLGFRMGGDAEAGHVDADDAHAVDDLRQHLQRHAGSRRHAQIGDDNGVVFFRIGHFVDGVADVLEQLAGHEAFAVERHVAHRAPCTVEVGREGQAVNAAGGAGQDRGRAAHTQADTERAESGAHALGLVVRPLRIVLGVLP